MNKQELVRDQNLRKIGMSQMKYKKLRPTSVCPVVLRMPDPPDAKFAPLRYFLLRDDGLPRIERNGGGLLL